MRMIFLHKQTSLLVTSAFMFLFLLSGFSASAQQLNMRDFVVFGGAPNCASCGVQIGTSTTIVSGRVGSYSLVKSIGNTQINGSIHSGGRIELANSNGVVGNLTAANNPATGGQILSTGSNANITGNVIVNGNVAIGGGSVNGQVMQSTGSSYSGPNPSGGRTTTANLPLPVLPTLPNTSPSGPANNNNITGTALLQPDNSYGTITIGGGRTVTFNGPGTYVFSQIKITGNNNRFVFDFKGTSAGIILIQVHGDVDLDKVTAQIVNGGSASRIFMQVYGNGATSASGKDAWSISNGASGNNQSIWYGTVWAPNGGILVGAGSSPSKVEGALWSGKTVTLNSGVSITHVPLVPCPDPVADAGSDQTIVCPATQTTIGTATSNGSSYRWTTTVNGVTTTVGNTPTITATSPNTYTLTVTNACGGTATDVVIVGYQSCVQPINTNSGKVNNIIGHELTNLTTNLTEAKKYLVVLGNDDSVLIEAVAVVGQEAAATAFLIANGLTDLIPNGSSYQIISGKYPIANLAIINTKPDLFNHCRPVFAPVNNAGLVTSEGDKSIGADLARGGFNLGGAGIKIGVISDSYNTLPGNRALQDVNNGDLPGATNPDGNNTPVEVLLDFPYGQRSDEGRAMLQIVHDLAPKAPLAFRTGFLSAGDFAAGIRQLKTAGCKVIVDDVTYITEPFFQDGVVARAVNEVNNQGVAYFTSAGNFGSRSYTSTFNRATTAVPGGIGQFAHNFGNGDIYQKLKLKSGTYTIVLQWQDNIYSLAQTAGTINDLDIYLVDPGGRIGFNRNNLAGDPFEVLSFSINLPDTSQVIEADLMIVKADNSADNPTFKYIIFRGNAVIDEYYSNQPLANKSTIMGQANAAGAIAVGAVLFSNTPAYGNTPSIASFSSTGGTPVFNGSGYEVRVKPELTAPNGVNTSTTVALGPDNDGLGNADGYPNFFGTSAAAPHAAAAAALVMEARQKFYGQELTTSALRFALFNHALPMQPDGVVGGINYKAGYGLVQPDASIRSFANPTPFINNLVYNAAITPGTTPFTLVVTGNYLSANSVIYFRGAPLPTTVLSPTQLQAQIPSFVGNPSINVFTPSFPGATGDGGLSNTLYFFAQKKDTVTIVADNKAKKYGEVMPQLTTTILVNGDSLHVYNQKTGKNLTRESLGVDNLTIRYTDPTVNPLSDVGAYSIRASRSFDPANPTDVGLLEIYQYDSVFGALQISKLAVTVKPRDTTLVYGAPLDGFQYNYLFDPTANLADVTTLTQAVKTSHEQYVDNTVLGVINRTGGGAVVVFNGQVYPVFNNASVIIDGRLYPVLNKIGGGAVVVFNGQEVPVTNLAGGGAVVVFNGVEYPVVNGGGAVVIFNGEILPVINKTSGGAVVVFNGVEYPVTNKVGGGAVVVFNGIEVPVTNALSGGGAVVIFNGRYYPVLNKVGGGAVVVFNGQEIPVLNKVGGGAVVVFNGQELPVSNGSQQGPVIFFNSQMLPVIPNLVGGGAVVVFNGGQQSVPYLNGVGGSAVVVFNGQILPVVNKTGGGAVVVFNGVEYPVVNRTSGGAVVVFNGQDLPLVNSVSATTLSGLSTSASLNAIANARLVNGQTDGFVDVAANAFSAFNTNAVNGTLVNALPYVNARALVDANALAAGGAVTVFNTFSGGGAVPIFNGSGAYVNSNTLSNASAKTPVVVDIADVNSAGSGGVQLQMEGINMITGITAGEQVLIPATLFNANFDISYGQGKVTITKAPINIKANDATKTYAEQLSLSPTAFSISGGGMKYGEQMALANLSSTGTASSANVGNYDIHISNAIGSYGTDVANYQITYVKGTLSVTASPCPIIVHSKENNFVSTDRTALYLWMNVQIKVRGQLVNAGDYIALKGGRFTLENVGSTPTVTNVWVPNGIVIAANVSQPVTRYDVATQTFITRVPLGFNSTADVFITGTVVNSSNGFVKAKNPGALVSGIFQSNVIFNGQWSFAMAAYKALAGPSYVQLTDLAAEGNVVAVSSSYKAGTPIPWLSRITGGGSGNGGSNYTGTPSFNDAFSSCTLSTTPAQQSSMRAELTEAAVEHKKMNAGLQIYPNPAGFEVTLAFNPSESGRSVISIFNSHGVKVSEVYAGQLEKGTGFIKKLSTASWPNGVYFIRVAEAKSVTIRKLVISH